MDQDVKPETPPTEGATLFDRVLQIFLLGIPATFLINLVAPESHGAIFAASCIALLGLAKVVGESTEELSLHFGDTVGGLINATFGNAVELILAFFALKQGHHEMVRASISGSIIGNLLLVLGAAVFIGGMYHKHLKFNIKAAGVNMKMLGLTMLALILPAIYIFQMHFEKTPDHPNLQKISLFTAVVLVFIYAASIFYSFVSHKHLFVSHEAHAHPNWSKPKAITILLLATMGCAYESEFIIHNVEVLAKQWGLSHDFIGMILLAVIGNAAEHSAAIMFAMRNKMDIAFAICAGSATQVALFVAPTLIFASYIFPANGVIKPMQFNFSHLEIVSVAGAIFLVELFIQDGEFEWFEGLILLAVYALIGGCFFLT